MKGVQDCTEHGVHQHTASAHKEASVGPQGPRTEFMMPRVSDRIKVLAPRLLSLYRIK